ncbi:MAG: glycosyltransferase family 39 protein [Sedimentisphaerales bacterium]|nr:glycosyltransferase family 39 protein [Sedimentisphaerales bacterium]
MCIKQECGLSEAANKKSFIIIILTVLIGVSWIVILGLNSDLYLGDETFHYRYASYLYQTKSRPLYDPSAGNTEEGKIRYVVEPLWHIGLAVTWALTTGISKTTAQFYHAFYFLLLLIATYLLAKQLYDKERAFYSMLLVGSVPLLVALSIIFHTDVPVTALLTTCFLMLFKKKYLWAGIFLGLSFLCKRNAMFLIPAAAGIIFWAGKDKLKRKFINLLVFGSVFAVVILPDLYFRIKNFGLNSLLHNIVQDWNASPIKDFSKPVYPSKLVPYDYNNFLYTPTAFIRDLGPLLLIFLGIYLLQSILQKKYNRKDFLLFLPILSYILLSLYFFWPILSIRYFFPVIPFLAIIGAGGVSLTKQKYLRYFLIFACIAQFFSASGYTFIKRRIAPPVKQAYEFVRTTTPQNARIMCTKNALALHTGRISIWNSYASLVELPYMFWNADEKEALEILDKYEIGYIFVEKDRIFDDTKRSHLGGYPQSFLEKVANWSSFERIFDNEEVAIWKITQSP